MYARFFRWASDRLHDDGVIAFVTNRSFIDSRTFDGFRRYVEQEFAEVYVVDLGGDVRANPRLSGTKHNVFGIQTWVAISLFVKKRGRKDCRIHYVRRPEMDTAEEKLAWLGANRASGLAYERIEPDKRANWINQDENDWEEMIPVADKRTKAAKARTQERAIFKLYSLGIVTNRDEWAYDFSKPSLADKIELFASTFNKEIERWKAAGRPKDVADFVDRSIKWTSELEAELTRAREIRIRDESFMLSAYRPFVDKWTYFEKPITHRPYQNFELFPTSVADNRTILTVVEPRAEFSVLGSAKLVNKDFFMPSAAQHFARYRFASSGERIDNITDWALNRFRDRYGKSVVTKDAIFHYVYAALHDPAWRETYAINLKREFPRIPFHSDFRQWADWGARLMALHVGYEAVEPWPLVRTDTPDAKAGAAGVSPRVILKADKAAGRVVLDSETVLDGLPPEAWAYRLGNRSGVEWVLDQHREKTPKDPTIRERFNTYRFADHKERVAELIARVARVSVETMAIVEAMAAAPREEREGRRRA
jgi:predicted helicase